MDDDAMLSLVTGCAEGVGMVGDSSSQTTHEDSEACTFDEDSSRETDSKSYAEGTYSIDDLPDELLRIVLAKVPFYCRAEECRLVCRRWLRLLAADCVEAWASVFLMGGSGDTDEPGSLLRQIQWLGSRAPMVQDVLLGFWEAPSADSLLFALAGMLAPHRRLRSLVTDTGCEFSVNCFHALQLLPSLERLEMDDLWGHMPGQLAGRLLGALTALTRLELEFRGCACASMQDGEFPEGIATGCRRLRHLRLAEAGSFGRLPFALTLLTDLRYLAILNSGVTEVPACFSRMTSLTALKLCEAPCKAQAAQPVQLPKNLLRKMLALRALGLNAPQFQPELRRQLPPACGLRFLQLTNIASNRAGEQYLSVFKHLAARSCLDLSSDADLCVVQHGSDSDSEEDGEGEEVVVWAESADGFPVD